MDPGPVGRVAIVSGGASGIGAVISRLLAEEGAVPAILTREEPDAAGPGAGRSSTCPRRRRRRGNGRRRGSPTESG